MPRVFKGGIPTDIDVANLFKSFGTPGVNTLVTYDAIASVIKVSVASNRFRTVVARWRAKLEAEPHNVYLKADPDARAYRVMDGEARVDKGDQHLRSIRGHAKRGSAMLTRTDTTGMSEVGKAKLQHGIHRLATVSQSLRQLQQRQAPQLPEGVQHRR